MFSAILVRFFKYLFQDDPYLDHVFKSEDLWFVIWISSLCDVKMSKFATKISLFTFR